MVFPQVKAGDTVEKGQILVSGAVPVYDDDGQNIVKYQIYGSRCRYYNSDKRLIFMIR